MSSYPELHCLREGQQVEGGDEGDNHGYKEGGRHVVDKRRTGDGKWC